jgi:hypothetical protein
LPTASHSIPRVASRRVSRTYLIATPDRLLTVVALLLFNARGVETVDMAHVTRIVRVVVVRV